MKKGKAFGRRADIARGNVVYIVALEVRNFWFTTYPTDQYRCSDTVEKFPGDQERSISTIRYFVSSPGCASARARARVQEKRCEGSFHSRSFSAPEKEGERIPWKNIRRRFQETRIVFRPGKLVIDTAARTSLGTFLPRRWRAFRPRCFSSTGDKNIFAPEPDVNNLCRRNRNVCHYCSPCYIHRKTRSLARFDETYATHDRLARTLRFIKRSLNCSFRARYFTANLGESPSAIDFLLGAHVGIYLKSC